MNDEALLGKLHSRFSPSDPLEAGNKTYVDCRKVRGHEDILTDLGRGIKFARGKKTCQLYTGHRGAGKSTELLRLQKNLEENGFYVVYFAADFEDIDLQDTEYADILNACARNIYTKLLEKGIAEKDLLKPLQTWWDRYFPTFQKILPSLENMNASVELPFVKISTALKKGTPNVRRELRRELESSTPDLVRSLNEFIQGVKTQLPLPYLDLVVIVDNLDRITYKRYSEASEYASNYEKIFIGQGEPLTELDCHIVYTFPLPLVFSSKGTKLRDIYDNQIQVLPMVAVKTPDNQPQSLGIEKMKEIVKKRANQVKTDRFEVVFDHLFDREETLEGLCVMSGGYVRGLLQLMQRSLILCDALPITEEVAKRAIAGIREEFYKAIQSSEWGLLAKVATDKRKPDEAYVNLLLNRCILEYHSEDEKSWYDVHPTIRGIPEFQEAEQRLKSGGSVP